MADFPTSKHTFTPFANGATADAAQVIDIYAEVEAIEDGYLNGTARLNSSNSTVANLSVAGGSTFAGTLTLSTQTYIVPSSRATVGDVLAVASTSGSTATLQWQSPTFTVPAALVKHSANQETLNNAWTGLSWDTEVSDPQGMHSTAANSSRLTAVHSTGLYQVGANVNWNANSNGSRLLRILCNDSSAVAANKVEQFSAAALGECVVGLARVADTTDYFTVQVLQNTGSTLSVTNSTTYATSFWIQKVSS